MHCTIGEILFEGITWLLVISKLHIFICVIRHTCLICNKLMLILSYLWLNCHFSIQKAIHIPCMDVWCYVDMFCCTKCSQWRLNGDIKGGLKTLNITFIKLNFTYSFHVYNRFVWTKQMIIFCNLTCSTWGRYYVVDLCLIVLHACFLLLQWLFQILLMFVALAYQGKDIVFRFIII
jgi:hypothetical protein